MRITRISATYGRKFNTGPYESADASMTVWCDVEEGDDLDLINKKLWKMARRNVRCATAHERKDKEALESNASLGYEYPTKMEPEGEAAL